MSSHEEDKPLSDDPDVRFPVPAYGGTGGGIGGGAASDAVSEIQAVIDTIKQKNKDLLAAKEQTKKIIDEFNLGFISLAVIEIIL